MGLFFQSLTDTRRGVYPPESANAQVSRPFLVIGFGRDQFSVAFVALVFHDMMSHLFLLLGLKLQSRTRTAAFLCPGYHPRLRGSLAINF